MLFKTKDKQVRALVPYSYLKYSDLNVNVYYLNNDEHYCYFIYDFGYINKNISPINNSHFACLSFLCCQLLVDHLNDFYLNKKVDYKLEESKFILKFENNDGDSFVKELNLFFEGLFNFDLSKMNIDKSINRIMLTIDSLINNNYLSFLYSKLYNDDKIPVFQNSIKDEFKYIKKEEINDFFTKYIYKNYDSLYIFSSLNTSTINNVLEKYHFENENNQSTGRKYLQTQTLININSIKLRASFKNRNVILGIRLNDFNKHFIKYDKEIYPILLMYDYLAINNYINCINKVKRNSAVSFSNNKLVYCYDKLFYIGVISIKDSFIDLDQVNKFYYKNQTSKNEFNIYKKYLLNELKMKSKSSSFILKIMLNIDSNLINYNLLYNLVENLDYETYKMYLDDNKENIIFSCIYENI